MSNSFQDLGRRQFQKGNRRSFDSLAQDDRVVDWEAGCSIDVGVCEEEFPRTVEVEPALAAEPAGGQGWNVEQGVSAHADHLGSVPAEEGARGQAHGGRVGDAPQADRAPLALVPNGPTEAEQTDREAPQELKSLGERRVADGSA